MGNTLFHLRQQFPKRYFDVANKTDLTMYKQFITTRSWGEKGCPFELEWPWLSIPACSREVLVSSVLPPFKGLRALSFYYKYLYGKLFYSGYGS